MKVLILVAFLATVAIAFAAPADPQGLKDDLALAKKYLKLIEQEGEKAWHFLECMGADWAKDCVEPTLKCVGTRDLPGCIGLIECEGKDAKKCADSFK